MRWSVLLIVALVGCGGSGDSGTTEPPSAKEIGLWIKHDATDREKAQIRRLLQNHTVTGFEAAWIIHPETGKIERMVKAQISQEPHGNPLFFIRDGKLADGGSVGPESDWIGHTKKQYERIKWLRDNTTD